MVAASAFYIFGRDVISFLFPLAPLVYVGIHVSGMMLAAYAVFLAFRTRRRWSPIAISALLILLTFILLRYGFPLGRYVNMNLRILRYQGMIAEYKRQVRTEGRLTNSFGLQVTVDTEPTLWIAIPTPSGPLARSVLIFDDQNLLLKMAESNDSNDPEIASLRERLIGFVGYVTNCDRMRDNWYYCSLL